MVTDSKPLYEVYLGTKLRGQLDSPHIAGFASLATNGSFYYLRLMMLPGTTFYLSKNNTPDSYTVFAKFIGTEESFRLQNPVGTARLAGDLKTHLEIRFPLLSRPLFMSLFPRP
jgi:hypothetical protein